MGPKIIFKRTQGLTDIESGAIIPKIAKFQRNFARFSRILEKHSMKIMLVFRDHLSSEIVEIKDFFTISRMLEKIRNLKF
jgi:hypothetical protein